MPRMFLAAGYNGLRATSPDGKKWSAPALGKEGEVFRAAAVGNGRLVAVGTHGGDQILAWSKGDGKWVDVVDWKLTEVVKLIRGPRGTKVELKVIPVGKVEPLVYAYTRQKVELKAQAARSENA